MAVRSKRPAAVVFPASRMPSMSLVWCCSSTMPAKIAARLAMRAENSPDRGPLFTSHGTTAKDVGWGFITEIRGERI